MARLPFADSSFIDCRSPIIDVRALQFTRQLPGPRGSPHAPHAPAGSDIDIDDPPDFADTANTETCLSSVRPWQLGHEGWRPAETSVSNR